MKTITAAGQKIRNLCGWDLAHAAGNIKLIYTIGMLTSFAWCSYKYMNSGPNAWILCA